MQSLTKLTGDITYLFKRALTQEECNEIIRIAERKGKDDTTACKAILIGQRRTKFEDYNLTERIYRKVKDDFEAQVKASFIASETMITYVVYSEGGECPLHLDSKVDNNIGKQEYITVIVYLNDFSGGRTYFKRGKKKDYVNTAAGDIMIFHGTKIPHGCDIVGSTKKVIIFGIEN
jgi:hypothetical protein